MHIMRIFLAAAAISLSAGSYLALAQQPAAPQQPMTFFVTSVSKGDGANYGGLAGADAHCQSLAQAAGRGNVKWVAYLSTQGPGAVNARDRIGQGPWYNARGAMIAANLGELHGDTLEQARLGNRLHKNSALTEKGAAVKGVGDTPNEHDILTGSTLDGRAFTDGMDHTCSNYSSSADAQGANVQVGHHDRIGNTNASWVSAHASRGCSAKALPVSGGAGYLYCFAPGN
jgi:hypothetical protein